MISAIRIVDKITTFSEGANPPDEMPPTHVNLHLLVSIVPGSARGGNDISMHLEAPSGVTSDLLTQRVTFQMQHSPAHIAGPVNLHLSEAGLHWIHVRFNGLLLTKIPLVAEFSRLATSPMVRPT